MTPKPAAVPANDVKPEPRVVETRKKIPFLDYLKEESAAWIADVVM